MLINRAAVKKLILDLARDTRPGWECSRVSGEALDQIESHVRNHVERLVHQHPTLGHTFKP